MRLPIQLLFPLILLFATACHKTDPIAVQVDCAALDQSLIDRDLEGVKAQIDPLAQDLLPQPTAGDETGHAANLNRLVERLNAQCDDYMASVLCYACIETFPLQSEIRFQLDAGGTPIERIVDLSTPEDDPLRVVNIHDE